MPIPAGACRFSIIGTLPQNEIFVTNFWTSANKAVPSIGDLQAWAAKVRDEFQADVLPAVVPMLATGGRYDEVRAYFYQDGGPTADIVGQASFTAGNTGSGTTNTLPLQTSLCVTLLTEIPGRSYRGRMYFPMAMGSLTAHQASATLINQVVTGLKNAFDGINAHADIGFVGVVSQKLGTAQVVTSLRADTRLDIQRRRAARQAATSEFSASVVA